MSSSTSPNHSDLPLAGLKVVDLSQGVAGPHCGMLFAQYGADVVKVEPTAGDWGRAIGAQHGDFKYAELCIGNTPNWPSRIPK